MQKIDETYRARLALLIAEHKTQAALSEVIGKAPAQISQWLNASKDSKTKKPRTMDRTTAREIERKAGKPEGWMDQPITSAPIAAEPHPDGIQRDALNKEVQQLLRDLHVLAPSLRHKYIDQVHQAAELARETIANDRERAKKTETLATGVSADERRAGPPKAAAYVTYGDGNARQGALPLSTVSDPFSAEPDEREEQLYANFKKAPRR